MPKDRQTWWDWLDDHIDRGDAADIAPHYKAFDGGRTAETIRAFLRTPKIVDPEHGSGQLSPPQIYEEFFNAFYLVKPKDALAMHKRVNQHVDERIRAHALSSSYDLKEGNCEIVKQFEEWMRTLIQEQPAHVVEKQLGELAERVEVQLAHLKARHLKSPAQNSLREVRSGPG